MILGAILGIPPEVLWPTLSFGAIIVLVFGGIVALRLLPRRKPHRDDAELQDRLAEFDQLAQRVAELEERLDFAERLLAQQREGERLGPGRDRP